MAKPNESLPELLAPFRAAESPEACVCILDDPDAKKVLSVWQFYPAEWARAGGKVPDGLALRWEWLWRGLTVDYTDLGNRAGVSGATAECKLIMLRGARLVYPDGGISHYASGVLRADVARRIPKQAKR